MPDAPSSSFDPTSATPAATAGVPVDLPAEPTGLFVQAPPAPLSAPHPTLLHSGMSVARFFGMHAMGVIFPLTAGLLLFGWRALVLVCVVLLSTAGATAVWRRIGARGAQLHYSHALWMALLLALMLPAHLIDGSISPRTDLPQLWPLPVAAGIALTVLIWILGGVGLGRIHPVLIAYLLLTIFFDQTLVSHHVLQRGRLFTGDVLDSAAPERSGSRVADTPREPWLSARLDPKHAAVWIDPPSQRLWSFTTGTERPDRAWLSLEGLLRDRMPPLEDLIIGAQPGAIGTGSAIAVIIGGLFLLYRGLIDYRIPLLIVLTAFVALLMLPIPVVITENQPQWRWLAFRAPGVGLATAITFVNYEILASPLLFMAFFLATGPAVRPMSRRGRTVYAILTGFAVAFFQLYASVTYGPYLGLLLISLLTPSLDKVFRPRALV
ncbi:MAG: RnfABCDGE type electron transport complex subunit D [Tepidisphaeraceae bacterium]